MSGLQAKARAARYGLMADLIDAEVWDQWASGMPGRHPLASAETRRVLVTAHHRDDAIETFLMRLKRGSGLEGLASIREVDTLRRPPSEMRPFPSAVRLCRPMLAIGKDRLIATANALGLAWQEDPSNSDARFERVRIRQQTTVLDELGLASEALQLSINRLGGARSLIDRACAVALGDAGGASAAVDWHGGLYATIDPNRLGLLQGPALPSEDAGARLMERVLRHVLARIGGAEEGPELAQLEALARQLGQGTAGMPGETIAGCRIDRPEDLEGRQPGIVRVWREAGRDGLPEISLGPGDGGWWDNRFAVSISAAAPGPVGIRALGIDGVRQLKTQLPEIGRWRGLPDGALATLPAAWSGDGLLAVPSLPAAIAALDSPLRTSIAAGLGDLASGGGFGIRAEFRPWSMA
jgi:tRNA(Ile)-lysidine synthase